MHYSTQLKPFWLSLVLMTAWAGHQVSAADPSYILKPGDGVLITVYQEDELTTEAQISPSGVIEFPLIGSFTLGGKTIKDAVAELTNKLGQGFVVDPKVTLTVTDIGTEEVIVVGQVNRPGGIEIPTDRSFDLLNAISMAGGFTVTADPGSVMIRRNVDGKNQSIRVDARKPEGEAFELRPDDFINVRQALVQQVTVMGEVKRSGFVSIPAAVELDLLSAIAMSGGYTEQANAGSVVIRRTNSVQRVNASRLASDANQKSVLLQPGDIVTVNPHAVESITLLGEVTRPGVVEIPADTGLDLLEAIAITGGYTDRANVRKVTVRRRVQDGDDKLYRVDAKKLSNDPQARPFVLKADDTITVPQRFF